MKIVLLSGANIIHTIRWANGLSRAGLEVHLITQHAPTEPLDEDISITVFPNRGVLGYFLIVPAVRRFLRDLKPDLVNAHYASGYATTARLAGYHPWVLSVWGSDVYDFPYTSPIHRWWVRKNLEAADLVASTSQCMAAQTRHIAPSIKDISITPFGVDIDTFSAPKVNKEEADSDHSIVIGTVKTLSHKYGIDTLIEAYARLRENLKINKPNFNTQLQLRLIGDGPERLKLEKMARDLNVSDTVTFVGRVPHSEVPNELRKLDIYAALSRLDSESFGVAVVEAGAAGLPVVVTDAGGLPEVVVEDKTGFVVSKDAPEEAAKALERFVLSAGLRREMGEEGVCHVSLKYSWVASVDTMIATLEKCISEHN